MQLKSQALKFNHFGVDDGLSQGNVTCILQDKQGFMWFGTWDGLNVYNGFDVRVFREQSNNPYSIKGALINSLLELPSHQMAVATSYCLHIFDLSTQKFYPYNIDQKPNDTKILKCMGQQLVLCINNQIWNFDLQTKKFTKESSPISRLWDNYFSKHKIAVNHSDHLYPNLYEILLKDTAQFVFLQKINDTFLLNDMVTYHSKTYLATDQGLYVWKQGQLSTITKTAKVKCLEMHHLKLYAGTQESGILVIELDQDFIQSNYQYDERDRYSLSGNFIRSMFISRDEVFWSSSLGNGVNFVNLKEKRGRSFFTKLDPQLMLKQDAYIKNLIEEEDSLLWVNTITGNVYLLDANYNIVHQMKPEQIDPKEKPNSFQQIYQLPNQDICLLTEKGLYRGNKSKGFTSVKSPEWSFNKRYMIHMSPLQHQIYLISTRQGLCIYNAENNEIKPNNQFDTSNVIISSYTDQKGHVYINPMFAGLDIYAWNSGHPQKRTSIQLGFNAKQYVEIKDTLWVATSMGILKINTRDLSYKMYDESDGLPNQCVYCLLPDRYAPQSFWSSSNKGIFNFNPQTKQVIELDRNDGLSGLEFNTNAFVSRKNGDLVFGGTNGFTVIQMRRDQARSHPCPMVLQGMMVGKEYASLYYDSVKKVYEIPYHENDFTARLLQLKYPNSKTLIRYRLKGFDEEIIENTNPVELRYSNLSIGQYELAYETLNSKNEVIWTTLAKIVVLAPWYLTSWAFLAYVIILLGILAWVINLYRIKIKQEKNAIHQSNELLLKERDRISADLHDDIGSTLSSISIYNDLIHSHVKTKPEIIAQLSEKMAIQIKELMFRTEDIIWSLKIGKYQHESIEKRVKEYANEFLIDPEMKVDLKIAKEVEHLLQHPEQRRNVLMIIKEAMNNCRKYSHAKQFELRMFVEQSNLEIHIQDDGIGFDMEQVNYGDGLINMQERCKNLDGKAMIQSEVNQGTKIICILPIARFSYMA